MFIISLHLSGKPSRPKGPIKIFDIQRTAIGVSWKYPEDDGGSPLTGFIVEKREAGRQYWSTVEQVQSDITSYMVHSLTPSHEYEFRVIAVNRIGHSEPLITDGATLAKSPFGKYLMIFFIYNYCFNIQICLLSKMCIFINYLILELFFTLIFYEKCAQFNKYAKF